MTVDAARLIRHEPVRIAMSKMAAGLRGTSAVAAIVSALIGLPATPSPSLLVLMLVTLAVWTGVYTWLAWTRGLTGWMIGVDILLGSTLCVLIGLLVPEQALRGGVNWVAGSASIIVICAQLAGRPIASVPAALVVVGGFIAGARLAQAPDGGANHTFTLIVQALAAAATMIVAIRTGRHASTVFAERQREEQIAQIRAAERVAALTQLRMVHNGPLTTLTMAIHTDTSRPSEALRRHAKADLRDLPGLTGETGRDLDSPVRLDERLARIAVWNEPQLTVPAVLPPVFLPAPVAAAFEQAAQEALENVLRHAGVDRARLELGERDGRVGVIVSDRGHGFNARNLGFGLREAVIGAMSAAGGSALIRSVPGEGTIIRLEWSRG